MFRSAFLLVVGTLACTTNAWAQDSNSTAETFPVARPASPVSGAVMPELKSEVSGMMAFGGQLTAWRVGQHGTELGVMATMKVVTAGTTRLLSQYATQSLSLGGSEGGFQAEYDNRFAYGLRVVRGGWGSLVARLGGDVELVATPHGATGALGPLADVGYQYVSKSSYLDLSWRASVPIMPAIFVDSGQHHTWQWFSTGPHLGARLGPFVFDGYVARTMEGQDMRTELSADLCGVTSVILCTKVREYRYDALSDHVTLLGLFIGVGDMSATK